MLQLGGSLRCFPRFLVCRLSTHSCSHARDIEIFILGIFLQATEYNANRSLDIWNKWKKWSRTLATSPVGPRDHPPPYPSSHQRGHHKSPCMANDPWLHPLGWEHSDPRWRNETYERNNLSSWCACWYETVKLTIVAAYAIEYKLTFRIPWRAALPFLVERPLADKWAALGPMKICKNAWNKNKWWIKHNKNIDLKDHIPLHETIEEICGRNPFVLP